MTAIASNTSPTWTRSDDNWTLASNGRTLAVIEPCWSDRHACLFLANSTGELTYDGMYSRRIARLRICLRLWFSRTGGGGARTPAKLKSVSSEFHHDAGHSWLQVLLDDVAALGLQNHISSSSYCDGGAVYLEEDCDMLCYLRAANAAGYDIEIIDEDWHERSFVRDLPRYVPVQAAC